MTQVPANVTIPGLPLGTTINVGASLIEAVQTASGQANSVQLTLNQVVSGILGIPVSVASGGTGTTALTAFGIVFGNGTAAVGVTAAGTTAWPLVGNGTALAPSFAVLSVPGGGTNTTTLTPFGVVFGNGTSTVGITGAGNTALALISPGPLTNPIFGQISLTAAVTGVLGVPNGGTNTSTLTANALLLGAGSSTLQFAVPSTAGNLLVDQGSTTNPAFKVVAGDVTISANGTTTIAANAVTFAKMQTASPLSVLGVAGAATATMASIIGAAGQLLRVNDAGTGVIFTGLNNQSGSTIKALADVTGTQAVTGVGFKPQAVLIMCANQSATIGWGSIGFSSGTTTNLSMEYDTVGNRSFINAGALMIARGTTDGSLNQQATLNSFDVDGFTLSWVKTGSPTGTATLLYLAMR